MADGQAILGISGAVVAGMILALTWRRPLLGLILSPLGCVWLMVVGVLM
ncbi:MAG: hypothetical protein QHH07_02590 [Sedimentisphaerales bacterium]|jgi:hypothetical protein|nr:hypothetical protein [Sedimentisphaerales bacterium]